MQSVPQSLWRRYVARQQGRPAPLPSSDEFLGELAPSSIAPTDAVQLCREPSLRQHNSQIRFGTRTVVLDLDGGHADAEPLRVLPHALSMAPAR